MPEPLRCDSCGDQPCPDEAAVLEALRANDLATLTRWLRCEYYAHPDIPRTPRRG